MTLRDLFDVFWTITELSVTAREPDGLFIHRWEWGEHALDKETLFQYHERKEGKLTLYNAKINAHGDPTRNGAEIGWGVKEKMFRKEMLDAPIRHMSVTSRGGTHSLTVDIEMARLTAMTMVPEETGL